jgi:hypothetical protein
VTAVVKRNLVGELSFQRGWLDNVVKEFYKVHGALGGFALVLHDTFMEEPYVGRTTGGGGYNIVIATEQLVVVLDEFLCLVLESGIAHGLTATSLLLGILNVKTKTPEKLVGCHTYLRVEGIYITGNE